MLELSIAPPSAPQFKKCNDSFWCRTNRDLFKGLLRGEIAPSNHVKSTTLNNDNGSLEINWSDSSKGNQVMTMKGNGDFLRLTLSANPISEQVILQDPTMNSNIKRGTREKDNDQGDHFHSNGLDISILGKYQIRIKKGNIPLITLNNLGSFECSTRKVDILPAVDHVVTEEQTDNTGGMDFIFHQTSHLYGLPERTGRLSLQDSIEKEPYRLFNLDVFGYEADSYSLGLYGSIPFLIGMRNDSTAIGLFYNNPSETWVDILTSKDGNDKLVNVISNYGGLDLWIIFGDSLKDLLTKYTMITGRPPMPPLHSLGYHQCRWNYNDQDDVAQVDEGFDKYQIPMDTIWLDIEHTDSKKYMTWDKKRFANPNDMIDKLKSKGRNLITIVDPHIKVDKEYHLYNELYKSGYYVCNSTGKDAFEGDCWPGKSIWVDFVGERSRKWWSDQVKSYSLKYGGIHIWNDMNEPSVFNSEEFTMPKNNIHHYGQNNSLEISHGAVHNIYGMFMQRATFEGLLEVGSIDANNESIKKDNQQAKERKKRKIEKEQKDDRMRPFVLSRSFYAGSQRWGAIWTGDNAADWPYLKALGPMLLSMGLAGLTFVGGDVGGFFGNPEPLLLTRWYQASCLTPFFRAHAHIESKRREPWLFGEPWTGLIRDSIKLRYQLLPLIYNYFMEAHETGIPILRPMVMMDHSMASIEDQWMIGDALLQKPIVDRDSSKVLVAFPSAHIWYSQSSLERIFNTNEPIAPITLDTIPIFIRGGSVIPRKLRMRRNTKSMSRDPYNLLLALDSKQSAMGTVYIDNGHSINSPFIKTMITMHSKVIENKIMKTSDEPLLSKDYKISTMVDGIVITGLEGKCPTLINLSLASNEMEMLEFECINSIINIKCVKNKKMIINLSQEWKIELIT